VLVVGFPIRASTALLIMVASLSGIARHVSDVVPQVIDLLHHALAG